MSDNTPPQDDTTVLIVEDEHQLADLYERYLSDEYEVLVTYTGDEAVDIMTDEIDVILLDRRMPGLSGDDVLHYIRSNGYDIRVAIVSAIEPDFDVIDMGFDEYLVKPVSADQLRDTVARMLSRSTYTETVRELAQLVAAKSALEEIKTRGELNGHEGYERLEERIGDLQADIEDLESSAEQSTDAFDAADYKSIFRDLGTGGD